MPEGTTYVDPKDNYEYEGASYYKEVTDKKAYEGTIETIEVGKTITKEYEVRVNKDITDGKVITNKCTTKYNDVTTESEELSSTLKSGDIRVTVKRITDRKIILEKGAGVKYYVFIENISNTDKKDVKIQTNMSEGLTTMNNKVTLMTNGVDEELSKDNIDSQEIDYNNEINIGDFASGEMKLLYYNTTINFIFYQCKTK